MKRAVRLVFALAALTAAAAGQSDSLLQAGLRLAAEGRSAEGIAVLLRAGADTGTAAIRFQLGSAYAALNDFGNARRFLSEAVTLDPANAALRFQYARFLHQNLVLAQADSEYRRVLVLDSTFAPAWFQLGQLGKLLNRPDSLLRSFYERAVGLSPEDYLSHYYLGALLIDDTSTSASGVDHLLAAIARNPSFVPALERLASHHFSRKEDAMAALYYRRAADLRPANPELRFYLGETFRRQKLLDSAFVHLREAVRLDPTKATYRGQLGYAFFQDRQYDSSVSAYRSAIRLEPENVQFHLNLALAFERLDSLEGAVEAYRSAIAALNPAEAAAIYLQMGHAYYRAHQYTPAKNAYQRALDIAPTDREALFFLALALDQNDDYAPALRTFKRYLPLIKGDSTMTGRVRLVESRIKFLEQKTASGR